MKNTPAGTVYELVNPSDAWSFVAPSDKIAFLVSLYVGRGKTPAKRNGWKSTFYLFGGDPAKDYEKEFKESFEGAIKRHRLEIIESLRSFMIHRERSPEVLTGDALEKWNDELRSSMNDFGGYALDLAKSLRKVAD